MVQNQVMLVGRTHMRVIDVTTMRSVRLATTTARARRARTARFRIRKDDDIASSRRFRSSGVSAICSAVAKRGSSATEFAMHWVARRTNGCIIALFCWADNGANRAVVSGPVATCTGGCGQHGSMDGIEKTLKVRNFLRFGAYWAGWRECRSVHRVSYAGKAEASPAVGVSCQFIVSAVAALGKGSIRETFLSLALSDHFRRDRHATDRRDV
jgi:hypothetical protein